MVQILLSSLCFGLSASVEHVGDHGVDAHGTGGLRCGGYVFWAESRFGACVGCSFVEGEPREWVFDFRRSGLDTRTFFGGTGDLW